MRGGTPFLDSATVVVETRCTDACQVQKDPGAASSAESVQRDRLLTASPFAGSETRMIRVPWRGTRPCARLKLDPHLATRGLSRPLAASRGRVQGLR